jgi:hypothetical protein
MMIFCNFERKSNHIMMTKSIFDYAMLIAWVLYLFMGGTLLWSKVPDKELYRPYKKSLILVAIAFLAIGINIMMGWLSYTINLDVDITIAFNFVSYYIIWSGSSIICLFCRCSESFVWRDGPISSGL